MEFESSTIKGNSIILLQDLASILNITPEYSLNSISGKVHAPTFEFNVQFGNIEATAQGRSKKEAKRAVALLALEKFFQNESNRVNPSLADIRDIVSNLIESCKSNQEEEKSTTVDPNPVGKLQEVCMKKKWCPPTYLSCDEFGPPHEKIFTISCTIESLFLETTGKGKSKKIAKKIAAQEMLSKVEKEYQFSEVNTNQDKSKSNENSYGWNGYPSNTNTTKDQVEAYIKKIKKSFDHDLCYSLSNLGLVDDKSINYCVELNKLAEQLECTAEYISIKKESNMEAYFVTLIPKNCDIISLPLLTSWDSNPDAEFAKQGAAKRALVMFESIL